ncbi:MAG: diaminopimelate decarboxylase [Candidatus Electronema aureum]|uniref:Diaminopimelate decarboxylase n=1 Tax=Candidatus Electronema aureum TaxID=2005002 RepID=A0A521G1B4_9BACT|nr:MAG: diaminopimelate decarboxylase [Candidatus Electronema aureum]
MNHFTYQNGELCCEDVRIKDIAAQVGTPFYLYSSATLRRHFTAFESGFAGMAHQTCFAVKACSNIAILNLFAKLGGGADIVSGGELFRALKAGVEPQRIIYSGVGKSRRELAEALQAGILMFNVESPQELDRLNEVAAELKTRARIAFRINPDVDPKTHAYISTGLAKNKFGIPVTEALQEYLRAKTMAHIEIVGVSCHIGSQLTQIEPFIEALRKVKAFIAKLNQEGIQIKYVDMGGGIGIPYDDEQPPHPIDYAAAVRAELAGMDCTLILEPGRVLVGNAGILVTEVQYTKRNSGSEKRFIVVDAAMNDLARPSLYGAFHEILPVRETAAAEKQQADVVGPICESGDFLAKDRLMPEVQAGELLAVMSSGAYGFSMSSTYNSRPRVAEVLVSGSSFEVIRQRECYDDLVRGEAVSGLC